MDNAAAVLSPADWRGGLDIVLLTHSSEYQKSSNTGVLVQQALMTGAIRVQRLLWSRVAPDVSLIKSLSEQYTVLVYPSAKAQPLNVDHWQLHWRHAEQHQQQLDGLQERRIQLILLDATWQLARKMYNQSPYLQHIPALRLESARPSEYVLRRNQTNDGWCTAETVVLLLKAFGLSSEALLLQSSFDSFNQRP
ncbi:tRNA-uridine aminocarboxypropyltransferase [Rheinheimera sp. 4Y26]|uniref:tRNA-uridine aminocarboxypropyltransferase n=1 Tax=Rheinheimera sp. 4Y26 TaxID=2977811 RepID=UPI0021B11B97|nr:tRNA-uridine aminocarboxypropyltransferase [Rheinheimera sp. 4Y26]MCT6700675.1 DTW domain-containing protein [Rheinheimera sp. 4Y26]